MDYKKYDHLLKEDFKKEIKGVVFTDRTLYYQTLLMVDALYFYGVTGIPTKESIEMLASTRLRQYKKESWHTVIYSTTKNMFQKTSGDINDVIENLHNQYLRYFRFVESAEIHQSFKGSIAGVLIDDSVAFDFVISFADEINEVECSETLDDWTMNKEVVELLLEAYRTAISFEDYSSLDLQEEVSKVAADLSDVILNDHTHEAFTRIVLNKIANYIKN